MRLVTIPLSLLLALIMGSSAARKARPGPGSIELRERLDIRADIWALVGVPEAVVAVGLLVGLAWGAIGAAAAAGGVLLMAGACLLHLRARLLGAALVPPVIVLLLAAGAAATLAVAA